MMSKNYITHAKRYLIIKKKSGGNKKMPNWREFCGQKLIFEEIQQQIKELGW